MLHVSGRATYTDDIPELAGTLHAALGLSRNAHAKIVSMSISTPCGQAPGVIAVFTAEDIPGENDCGPIIHGDDPILADGVVQYRRPAGVRRDRRDVMKSRAAPQRCAKSDDVVRYELPGRSSRRAEAQSESSSSSCRRCI